MWCLIQFIQGLDQPKNLISLAKQTFLESNRTLFPIGVKAIKEVKDKKLVWEKKSIDTTEVIQNQAVVGIMVKPNIRKTHVGKCI